MSISKDKTDRLFAEKLGNHSVEPRAKAWDKLEGKLKQKQRKIIPIWQRMGIAASVLILFFAGGLMYLKKNNRTLEGETIASNTNTPKSVVLEKSIKEVVKISKEAEENINQKHQPIEVIKVEKTGVFLAKNSKSKYNQKAKSEEKQVPRIPEFMASEPEKNEFIAESISPKNTDNQVVKSEKPEELTIVFTLANFDNNSSTENIIEKKYEEEKKPKYLSRFFKQLINAKKGDKVDWNEVGFKPAKILARAENKFKSTKEDLNASYQTLKNKTVL